MGQRARTCYTSSCSELSGSVIELPPSTPTSSTDLPMSRLRRSPSLPPIHTSPSQDDGTSQSQSPPGDETSGYNSDCSWPATRRTFRESESRARWGDRGVGVGHLWEPAWEEPSARLPPNSERLDRTAPFWLERGLSRLDRGMPPGNVKKHNGSECRGGAEVLIIDHGEEPSTPYSSGESRDSETHTVRTFLLGQNTPLDPDVIRERERKRQKAQQLQAAIKKQLEERELQRLKEKEKRALLEQADEERIRREKTIEKKRLLEEQAKQREREDREEKKQELMRKALEEAERRNREEKRLRRFHLPLKTSPKHFHEELNNEKNENVSKEITEMISRLTLAPARTMEEVELPPPTLSSLPSWQSCGIQVAPTHMPPTRTERTLTPTQLRRRDCSTQTELPLPKRRSLRWRHDGCIATRCRGRRQIETSLPQPPDPPPPTRAVRQSDRETAVQKKLRMQLLLRAATSQRANANRCELIQSDHSVLEPPTESSKRVTSRERYSLDKEINSKENIARDVLQRLSSLKQGLQRMEWNSEIGLNHPRSVTISRYLSSIFMLNLDDLLGGNKEPPPILDFSKTNVNSEEEFRKLRDQVADYKIRPEKVKPDEIRIQEHGFSWKPRGRELRRQRRQRYPFANPIPLEMRHTSLSSLAAVSIDWRMLTSAKPKAKQDEEYFTKLITMAKSQIRSNIQERRAEIRSGTGISFRPSIFSRGRGRRKSCPECGEELCSGSRCGEYTYDASTRLDDLEEKTEHRIGDREKQNGLTRKRKKKRRRKRSNKQDEMKNS